MEHIIWVCRQLINVENCLAVQRLKELDQRLELKWKMPYFMGRKQWISSLYNGLHADQNKLITLNKTALLREKQFPPTSGFRILRSYCLDYLFGDDWQVFLKKTCHFLLHIKHLPMEKIWLLLQSHIIWPRRCHQLLQGWTDSGPNLHQYCLRSFQSRIRMQKTLKTVPLHGAFDINIV